MSGDTLARGARSATFGPPKNVTQSKWDAAFENFDPEVYRTKEEAVGPNLSISESKQGSKK